MTKFSETPRMCVWCNNPKGKRRDKQSAFCSAFCSSAYAECTAFVDYMWCGHRWCLLKHGNGINECLEDHPE